MTDDQRPVIRFETEGPWASLKNGRKFMAVGAKRRVISVPSDQAVADKAMLRFLAARACAAAGLPANEAFGADDCEVRVTWHSFSGRCEVEVSSMGPPPKGKTGRTRDLQNLIEALCDALNDVVWRDDRQVARVVMEMVRD